MPVPKTTGQLRTRIEDMEIGDYISCRYTALSGQVGEFSDLGTAVGEEIPLEGAETPNGIFYFIKVDKGLLVADRVIQNNITWNTLNNKGFIQRSNFQDVSSLNYGVGKADYPKPVVYNDELYIAWQEGSQIRVKKLTEAGWSSADGYRKLNYTENNGYYPSLIVYNNELYIFWHEYNTYNQIRVKKLTENGWVSADNDQGLNYNLNAHAVNPKSIIYNNELYVFWSEVFNSRYQIRAKKLTENGWVSADNNKSLNYNTSQDSDFPEPIVYNNELYVFWHENNRIRAKKLEGSDWVSVDNNQPLNYNLNVSALYPFPIVFNNELYVFWQEVNNSYYQIRAKKLTENGWVSADNNKSLNYNLARDAYRPVPVEYNNELYVVWHESNPTNLYYLVRIKKLTENGWVSADNDQGFRYSSNSSAINPQPIVYKDSLYIIWREGNQIAVKKVFGNNKFKVLRSLTGGVLESRGFGAWSDVNEYDRYIVNFPVDLIQFGYTLNDVFHVLGIATITQDTPFDNTSNIVLRGGVTEKGFISVPYNASGGYFGFRPVIEYKE